MAVKHGLFAGENKHKNKRIYSIWRNMKYRCYRETNKDYEYYGAKGIRVCDEWLESFFTFYQWAMESGYSEHLSLDRINNDEDYSPDNCRWATLGEQNNNKSNNVRVQVGAESFTVAQLSERYGINYGTLHYRVKHNWPASRILSKVRG